MELSRKVGEMTYDGLISDLNPKVEVRAGEIRKLTEKATYSRGTILAKSSIDSKLVILGTDPADAVTGDGGAVTTPAEVLTPYAILTDDTDIGTEDDVTVTVYTAGCFDVNKCAVADLYTITDADFDELRKFNIVFKSAQA